MWGGHERAALHRCAASASPEQGTEHNEETDGAAEQNFQRQLTGMFTDAVLGLSCTFRGIFAHPEEASDMDGFSFHVHLSMDSQNERAGLLGPDTAPLACYSHSDGIHSGHGTSQSYEPPCSYHGASVVQGC